MGKTLVGGNTFVSATSYPCGQNELVATPLKWQEPEGRKTPSGFLFKKRRKHRGRKRARTLKLIRDNAMLGSLPPKIFHGVGWLKEAPKHSSNFRWDKESEQERHKRFLNET